MSGVFARRGVFFVYFFEGLGGIGPVQVEGASLLDLENHLERLLLRVNCYHGIEGVHT